MEDLTKYEITRIIGIRATQIAFGALSTVDIENMDDPIEIAKKELKENKIPLILCRKYPDGKVKEISLTL